MRRRNSTRPRYISKVVVSDELVNDFRVRNAINGYVCQQFVLKFKDYLINCNNIALITKTLSDEIKAVIICTSSLMAYIISL